jgi:hypothetical protein
MKALYAENLAMVTTARVVIQKRMMSPISSLEILKSFKIGIVRPIEILVCLKEYMFKKISQHLAMLAHPTFQPNLDAGPHGEYRLRESDMILRCPAKAVSRPRCRITDSIRLAVGYRP